MRFSQFSPYPPTAVGYAEWGESHIPVVVNGPAVPDNMSVHVAVVHEVRLAAGRSYQIQFTPAAGEQEKVFLFGHLGGGAYWAPRSAALLQTNGTASFTPEFGGTYALVVVADAITDFGTTQLRVTGPVAGAGDSNRAAVTRLTSTGPNPAHGSLELRFELATPAPVSFDLIDVGGRAVAHLDVGTRDPGEGHAQWRFDDDGARVSPGLYFVRMSVGGHMLETRRVTFVR